MPNIVLTNSCNRKCPYCFAKSKLSNERKTRRHISVENFSKALDFLDVSNAKQVNILGGEPSLHPQFVYLLKYALCRNFATHIFTNGMFSKKLIEAVGGLVRELELDFNRLRLVVNYNEKHLRSDIEDKLQTAMFEKLSNFTVLSYNLFDPECNMSFLMETIQKYNLSKTIRIGLANPIAGENNSYLPISNYKTVYKKLVDFTGKASEKGIHLAFDCGFPMCLFEDEDLGCLYRAGTILKFNCGPPIDIGPNLDVWFCFPLSKNYYVKLHDFEDLAELRNHFEKKFETHIRKTGIFEKCVFCNHLKYNRCSGGCIAHQLKAG